MDAEIELYLRAIAGSLERILGCLDGLDDGAIRWRPLVSANCLAVIANHAMANAERNVLGTFAGRPYDWRREEEFLADGATAASLGGAWARLRPQMNDVLEAMPGTSLDSLREHPRLGAISGRAVLLQAVRHAAEHVGEAELTRALVENGGRGH